MLCISQGAHGENTPRHDIKRCALGALPSICTQTGEKMQLISCIHVVYVHNTKITTQSYVYGIVINITQDITETTDEDSKQHIVPLVLPMQLESEDSDSDYEDETKDVPGHGVDKKPAVYDEDVDGVQSEDTFKGNEVGNDEKPVRVSGVMPWICIINSQRDKLN